MPPAGYDSRGWWTGPPDYGVPDRRDCGFNPQPDPEPTRGDMIEDFTDILRHADQVCGTPANTSVLSQKLDNLIDLIWDDVREIGMLARKAEREYRKKLAGDGKQGEARTG